MFKIGQFANLNLVSVKTLRYYESIGIFMPAKIDKFTGYRYYSASQMQRLNKILAFKDMGFTLNEIADLLSKNINSAQIKAMLSLKKSNLKATIRDANNKLDRIEKLIEQYEEERNYMYSVSVKKVNSFIVASYRDVRKSYGDQGEMWQILTDYIQEQGAKILAGCFVSFHDYSKDAVDIEIFEPIDKHIPATDKITVKDMPNVTVASVVHKGPYSKLSKAYSHIAEWIEQNDYEVVGICREIYIAGEWNSSSEDDYITELQIPVMRGL